MPRTRSVQGRPLLLVVGLGLLLVAAAAYIFSGQRGTPELAVDPTRIDLGTLALGTPTSFQIRVTNTGAGALRFAKAPYIEVLEGC